MTNCASVMPLLVVIPAQAGMTAGREPATVPRMGSATLFFWSLTGYLLGSVPFGLLLTRAFGAGDLRTIGSGNIGATNVLRTGRKDLALATLLLDGGKGALVVFAASHFTAEPRLAAVAGLAAFAGHVFPWWSRGHGGKGVATMLGVTLAAWWPAGLAALVIWLIGATVTRYSSVGGMLAALTTPVLLSAGLATSAAWLPPSALFWVIVFIAMAVVVILKHRDNIRRLRAGTESRIGASSTVVADADRLGIGGNRPPEHLDRRAK